MKEKRAFVNAVFGAMEAVDGAKKVGKAYNNTENKYDDLMGTKLVKAPKTMGGQNALVSGKPAMARKTASEQLDYLYKEAGAKDFIKGVAPKVKQAIPKIKDAVDSFDAKNTEHLVNAAKAFKNKQVMSGLQHAASAAPGTLLGAGMIAGSGIGTAKLLKKLDGRDNPQNNIEYNTIGGAISAGMALNALGSGRMLAPASKALGLLASHATKVPVNVVRNTPAGKAINIVGQGVKASAAQANKINKDISFIGSNVDALMKKGASFEQAKKQIIDKQIQVLKNQNWQLGKTNPDQLQKLINTRMGELSHAFDTVQGLIKKASSQLDDLCKVAGVKTDYLQGVIKNKFFKPGLESLPYYAGPAMIGLMVDKKVERKLKDAELYKAHQEYLKNKENQPQNPQEKVASAGTVFLKNPGADRILRQSLESAVEGVGRMAVPLAASAVIGRDITNSLKKMDRSAVTNGTTPDEASIQLSRRDRRQIQRDLKGAQTKVAEELPQNNSDVVEEITREVEREIIGAKEKLEGEKIHIGNGLKKQFRMNPGHGMHGMTE